MGLGSRALVFDKKRYQIKCGISGELDKND
jgi:hypothetical protein